MVSAMLRKLRKLMNSRKGKEKKWTTKKNYYFSHSNESELCVFDTREGHPYLLGNTEEFKVHQLTIILIKIMIRSHLKQKDSDKISSITGR